MAKKRARIRDDLPADLFRLGGRCRAIGFLISAMDVNMCWDPETAYSLGELLEEMGQQVCEAVEGLDGSSIARAGSSTPDETVQTLEELEMSGVANDRRAKARSRRTVRPARRKELKS